MSDEMVALLKQAGLLAGALAVVVVLVVAWPWRRPSSTRRGIGWTLAVSLGFYAGCTLLGIKPAWPAEDPRVRLLTLILPATIVIEIVCAFLPGWWVWPPRFLLAAAVAPTLLYDTTYLADKTGDGPDWPLATAALVLSGVGVVIFLAWLLLDRLQARSSDKTVGASLTLAASVAVLAILLLGHYLEGAQLCVPLAGALGGATVASLLLPAPIPPARFSGVGLIGLCSIILLGRYFGSLSDFYAACLFIAPLVAWAGEAPRFVIRLVFVALVLAPVGWEVAQEIKKQTTVAVEEAAPPQP